MVNVNTSVMDFSDYVSKMLQEYGYEVVETMTETIQEVAKEGAKKIRTQSETPVGKGGKRKHGKYAKGWTVKNDPNGRFTAGATIHGKDGTYQLAHLLEFGHAHRQGGRSKAITHISIAEQWTTEEAYERTVHRLEGGI